MFNRVAVHVSLNSYCVLLASCGERSLQGVVINRVLINRWRIKSETPHLGGVRGFESTRVVCLATLPRTCVCGNKDYDDNNERDERCVNESGVETARMHNSQARAVRGAGD